MPPRNAAKKKKQEALATEVKKIRKQKENLTCADCPTRSTPYVCTNFSTFICVACSGIHRKFNHRVKSIAVATFNEKEVENIRVGGNKKINAQYLAKYKKNKDSFTLPREGETEKIEKYIQLKYIDKKWYKENPKPIKKKKKKKKKKKRKKSISITDSEEEEQNDNDNDDSIASSPPKQQSKQQQVQEQKDDILSFDDFGSPPEDAQPSQNNNAQTNDANDDWGDFGNGDAQSNVTPQVVDNQNWDPFDSTPTQQIQQQTTQNQQQVQSQQPNADSMGWDNSLWDDEPQQPTQQNMQQNVQPQQQNDFGFGNDTQQQSFNQNNMNANTNANANFGFNQQPQQQVTNIQNNADDLWGAINSVNSVTEQQKKLQEEAERKAKEEEAKKKAAEAEKNKPFSDPFGDLMGGIDGIKASNDQPPQHQQQNSMLGTLGQGNAMQQSFGQMNMQPQVQQNNNAYMHRQHQSQQSMNGYGYGQAQQAPQQQMQRQPSNQYMNVGMNRQPSNQYLNQQNGYAQPQTNGYQQQQQNANPYASPPQNVNPYAAQSTAANPYMTQQPQTQNNPYMSQQNVQVGNPSAAANPFR